VTPVVGVLLAGGRSERMGGSDKSFALLDGKPLVVHVAERLAPQVETLVVSTNADPAPFAALALSTVADRDQGYNGPLAGMLAGMDWTIANVPDAHAIVTAAVDTPFIPRDLVARLDRASGNRGVARIAASAGRLHQTIGMWPLSLRSPLAQWLDDGRSRAVRDWLAACPHVAVDFDVRAGVDPFFNINTPDDLERAQVAFLESSR
jgi:molybdopterin-guanine dinucleotide biosynthesis protein A